VAEMRDVQRQPITVRRDCSLGIIAFKQLTWTDHIARIVDINKLGVGIEVSSCVEPGFVWFKDRVWGYRGGLLLWSKQVGTTYRAGIKFLSLSSDEERSLHHHIVQSGLHRPLADPEKVVASLIESLKKEGQ
jgi:hypothetical protein